VKGQDLSSEAFRRLREKAERLVKEGKTKIPDIDRNDLVKLAYELEIYHTEMEVQNEELRHAKAELETSRNEFFDLYESAPVAYLTLSKQGIIEKANQAGRRMFEYTGNSLIGSNFHLKIFSKDFPVYYSLMNRLGSSRQAGPVELRLKSDGEPRYVHVEAKAKIEKDELKWRLALMDITDRKLSEKALKESEEQLRIAVEGGRLGTWHRNLNTGETIWNRYLYKLLGRDPDGPPVTGETFFRYIHPDDVRRVREHVDETFRKGNDFFDEFRVVREDKEVRWLAAAARVYRDEKGRPIRLAGVNYDITERKRAEEKIRWNEARFRSFIELTDQFGWITDKDGNVAQDLPMLEKFTGLNKEDLKGFGWLKAIHPDDRKRAERLWKEAVSEKRKYETEYRLRRFDGMYRHFLARGVPIFEDDTSVREWVGICIDITERKELENLLERSYKELEARVEERTAELNEKQRELEVLNTSLLEEIDKRKKFEEELKEKGEKVLAAYRQRDFLSRKLVDMLEKERHNIGSTLHDQIGQILAGMTIQLEGLKKVKTADGSDLSDRVEPIQGLLRNLILQAKTIAQNLRSDVLERFGLEASVRQMVKDVQKQSGLKINLFIKSLPEDIKEDGIDLALYRLIQEALTNVVKYAGAKEVFISLSRRDKFVSLTIEDEGKGFDYDMVLDKKSFDSPLGITIMRERVSMLGGEFRIESEPGKGTHIHAQIPLDQ